MTDIARESRLRRILAWILRKLTQAEQAVKLDDDCDEYPADGLSLC